MLTCGVPRRRGYKQPGKRKKGVLSTSVLFKNKNPLLYLSIDR